MHRTTEASETRTSKMRRDGGPLEGWKTPRHRRSGHTWSARAWSSTSSSKRGLQTLSALPVARRREASAFTARDRARWLPQPVRRLSHTLGRLGVTVARLGRARCSLRATCGRGILRSFPPGGLTWRVRCLHPHVRPLRWRAANPHRFLHASWCEELIPRVPAVERSQGVTELCEGRHLANPVGRLPCRPNQHCPRNRFGVEAADVLDLEVGLGEHMLASNARDEHVVEILVLDSEQILVALEIDEQQELDGRLREGRAQGLHQAGHQLHFTSAVQRANEDTRRCGRHLFASVETVDSSLKVAHNLGIADVVVPEAATPAAARKHRVLILEFTTRGGKEVFKLVLDEVDDAVEWRPAPVEHVREIPQTEGLQRARDSTIIPEAHELMALAENHGLLSVEPHSAAARLLPRRTQMWVLLHPIVGVVVASRWRHDRRPRWEQAVL
mmetsp:Transcript_58580/g.155979  ORF Transcript_58580/g.155979 Transcript_58580/m.155979 type:complete len:443 (+) Transcript_58580:170-1498(+)